jgi:integral membrane sensor domain MASE1
MGRENRWRAASAWLRVGLFFLAYFLAAELGYVLSVHGAYPTLWPPAGLLLAVLLLSDTRDWPALIAVGVLGSVSSDLLHGRVLVVAAGLAVVSGMEGLAGAALVRRFVGAKPNLQTVHQVHVFVLFGALLAPVIGASLGTVVNVIGGMSDPWWGIWVMWWIGDATAVIVIAPPILLGLTWWHDIRALGKDWRRGQPVPLSVAATITVLFAVASWLMFNAGSGSSPYKFVLLVGILGAGVIGGPIAGAGALFAIAMAGTAGMAMAAPPTGVVSDAQALAVIQGQGFFVVAGISSLMLSGVLLESKRFAADAQQNASRLQAERAVLIRAEEIAELGSWRFELETAVEPTQIMFPSTSNDF